MNMLFPLLVTFVTSVRVNSEWIKEMEDKNLYQGDMVLTPVQQEQVRLGTFRFASVKSSKLWPKGKPIAYEIASSIDGKGLQAINEAIADYHQYTCIRFKKRTTERHYLYFYRGAGCSSPVGFRGYYNDISLGRNCWKKGVVMHEIAHSLGVFHEQSRPDRDKYIKILWENIQGDEKVNFQKEPASNLDPLIRTQYDLKSMMHYPSNAFGGGKMTIKVLDPSKQSWIGQRNGFSEIDKIQLNLMYCGGTTNPRPSTTPPSTCSNKERHCVYWASKGYCEDPKEKKYMETNCCKACKDAKGHHCKNDHQNCENWAKNGQCQNSRAKTFMTNNCKKACNLC